MILTLLALFVGCTPAPSNVREAPVGDEPEDNFGGDSTVRVTAPVDGATVEETFEVTWTRGDAVDEIRVKVDGQAVTAGVEADKASLTLTSGRHTIGVIALDSSDDVLSTDTVEVRVVSGSSGGPWVTITSPSDNSHPPDPVQFTVEWSTTGVDKVELFADDWLLGEVGGDGVLTYNFAGVGFERDIEARAYDKDGNTVAVDGLVVTPEEGVDPGISEFNDLVVAMMATYPTDGTYTYYWPTGSSWPGTTRDLWYQDEKVGSTGGYSSCYCSGITFELFLRAWQEWDEANGGDGEDLNGMSADDLMDFRLMWYVEQLDGPGPSVAMEAYGVGTEVEGFDNWKEGDFVQLWRKSGSGHTVVFRDWEYDSDGDRIGMQYTSCQNSTDGYGTKSEYFGSGTSALDPDLMWAARAAMPDAWY